MMKDRGQGRILINVFLFRTEGGGLDMTYTRWLRQVWTCGVVSGI